MFALDASSLDKSLPVPVGKQLHGLLSYMLTSGDIPPETKLQSVRALAAQLGIAPMTVSQVYQQLRDEGLIEMRQGRGAYCAVRNFARTPEDRPVAALRADIEMLLGKAEKLGVSAMSLVSMINAQSQLRRTHVGLTIVFVCIFEGPGRDYVNAIKPVLSSSDTVVLVTIDALRSCSDSRAACARADLILTFASREKEVRALVGDAEVLGLRFLPSERTRLALAGIDPRARITAVSYFEDYVAIMRPSVLEFAPHVADITVTWLAAPDFAPQIAGRDVVVYASGADQVADHVQPGTRCFEYRHVPDPGMLETALVPFLVELRRRRIAQNETLPTRPTRKASTA